MKPLLIAAALFLFYSCSYKVQIMDVATEDKSITASVETSYSHVYQNDSIAVIYTFWAQYGVVSFAVYNKLDKPIYVDWKKCSYISSKGDKMNYWNDDKTVTGVSSSKSTHLAASTYWFGSRIPAVFGGTVTTTSQTVAVQERVTFIPPRSYYYRGDFYVGYGRYYATRKENEKEIPSLANPNRTTKARVVELSLSQSPFKFRNYLTWSTKETFDTEYYLDHEFYVSKVTEVRGKEFSNPYDDKGIYWNRNDRYYVFKPKY